MDIKQHFERYVKVKLLFYHEDIKNLVLNFWRFLSFWHTWISSN